MSHLSIALVFIILTSFALAQAEEQGFKLSSVQLSDEVSQIDQILQKEHSERKIKSPAKIDDGLLMRRIFLSAAGRIPTVDEYQKWLNSDDSLNKEALIDHLIRSKAYSSQMFNWWADHLRAKSIIMGGANQIGAGFLYVDWLKTQVSENVPYDEMARMVVASEGYPWENGAVGYYLRDDGMPLENMSNTAELFPWYPTCLCSVPQSSF